MKTLIFDDGAGGVFPLTDNLKDICGVLRWLAALGKSDLVSACAPLAEALAAEDKLEARTQKTEAKLTKARDGERVHGEPVVILKDGKDGCYWFSPGQELTLDEVDTAAKLSYAGAQLALQRAKKAGSVIGILHKFKGRSAEAQAKKDAEDNVKIDRGEPVYEEDPVADLEILFCRVSDLSVVAEDFPEAAARWQSKYGGAK